eukprot:scaffold74229_cov36-Phaeocystis_antarctica.AAC.2
MWCTALTLARQRTMSEWPTRAARMPRFSKPGMRHSLSAQSLHAVTSTGSPGAPSLPASLVRSSAVMPDGWLCLEVKRNEIGDFGGGSLSTRGSSWTLTD